MYQRIIWKEITHLVSPHICWRYLKGNHRSCQSKKDRQQNGLREKKHKTNDDI